MSEKKPSKSLRRDWRDVQRRRRFRDFYLQTGNALDSALAAGYADITAKTHAHRMAAAAEETLRDQCDLLGLTKMVLAQTLRRALFAKEPKWNQKTESWDLFEDSATQLAAYDRLKAIIEPEVPKPQTGALKVGVRVAAAAAEPSAWLERNKDRVSQVAKAGVTVDVTIEPGGNGNGHGNGNGDRGV